MQQSVRSPRTMDFLRQNVTRGANGKLLIKPSQENVALWQRVAVGVDFVHFADV